MLNWKKSVLLSVTASSLIIAAAMTGCGDDSSSKSSTYTLRIAETTDMHGQIFPYDFINSVEQDHSLAQVSSYVKEQRSAADADKSMEFIIVDNGDLLQGQPIVNVYNNKDLSQPGVNHIYSDTMNYVGYEMSVVGNHDVEPGHAVYDEMVKELNFPWLAANLVKEGTNDPYFEAYHVRTLEDSNGHEIKVAFLGLTTPGVPNWLPKELWSGIEYKDMVESATYWMNEIKTKENPDVIVGVFHSGFDYLYDGYAESDTLNPNATQMVVKNVPGFDVVFFGHDHAPNIAEVDGVTVLGGGSYANMVHVADIELKWNESQQAFEKSVTASAVEMSNYEADADFMSTFNDAFEETKAFVDQPIGTITDTITSRDAMFGDAEFNDIVHAVEFHVANDILGETIDMSIAAPLQYDVTLETGDIKYADAWKLYKYDNTYYVMSLSGQEVVNYLEYNYDLWMNQMADENDHLINFTKDENGDIVRNDAGCAQSATSYYNFDSIAGITYTVDVSQPKGSRITVTGMDRDLDGQPDSGESFDLSTTYKVGINSYRAGGGGGHMVAATGISSDELPDARTVTKTETGLREYLINYIKDMGTYEPMKFNNWKVIPEDWAAKGAEKSYTEFYSDACTGH